VARREEGTKGRIGNDLRARRDGLAVWGQLFTRFPFLWSILAVDEVAVRPARQLQRIVQRSLTGNIKGLRRVQRR
jgi:hypothetical protein